MEKVISELSPDLKVIAGHGPVSSLDEMRAEAKMLRKTREVLQNARTNGKTREKMKQAKNIVQRR